VPCQLSYRFAKAISNDIKNDLTPFDRSFKTRVKITLTRQKNNGNKPIVSVPVKILEEANDIHKIHKTYKAKPTKNLRRKLLSSKLEDNSCIVIFENAEINGGKITGSNIWKACIQKGVGKSYSRTYLDNISIPILLSSIESSPEISQDIPVIKGLINSLLFDIDNGIPELTNDWVEFPGWKKIDKAYLKYISANRRSLPAISVFQKMFTSEMPDIGNLIGPIDLFDGMDAVMLKNINDKNNIPLISKLITIDILEDNGNYVHRLDKRIEPKMIDTKIPLITIIAGLITVHTLNKMYSLDADIENEYSTHIRSSDEQIQNWCSTNTKSFKKYLQMSLGDTTAEFSK
jgi:cell division protein ZapA (FtsZ GTPase activity inhibitor)